MAAKADEASIRQGNPSFSRLLDVVRTGCLQGSLLRSTAERLHQLLIFKCPCNLWFVGQQAELRLQSTKQQYLECDTVCACVGPGMATAEIGHCLRLCPGHSVLGVEGGRVRSSVGRTAARGHVEESLKLRCLQMLQWQDSRESSGTSMESLSLAKTSQLPQLLTQQVAELREAEVQLQTREVRMRTVHRQWQALTETCKALSTVLETYKLGVMADKDSVTLSHLQSQCLAMLGKQKVVQHQLIKAICSDGRLQALQQLRHHLNAAQRDFEEKLTQTGQSVQHYQSYGREFVSLAAEYHHLLAEIDNKQWALNELGKSVSS